MGTWESNGHVTDNVTWPWKVKVVPSIDLEVNISKMAGDSDLVTMELLEETCIWESSGHVTDDVTWPWKVKVVTPISLGPNISETAGDKELITMPLSLALFEILAS